MGCPLALESIIIVVLTPFFVETGTLRIKIGPTNGIPFKEIIFCYFLMLSRICSPSIIKGFFRVRIYLVTCYMICMYVMCSLTHPFDDGFIKMTA